MCLRRDLTYRVARKSCPTRNRVGCADHVGLAAFGLTTSIAYESSTRDRRRPPEYDLLSPGLVWIGQPDVASSGLARCSSSDLLSTRVGSEVSSRHCNNGGGRAPVQGYRSGDRLLRLPCNCQGWCRRRVRREGLSPHDCSRLRCRRQAVAEIAERSDRRRVRQRRTCDASAERTARANTRLASDSDSP